MHNGVHVHVKDLKVSAKEDKLKRVNSSQKMNEPERNRSFLSFQSFTWLWRAHRLSEDFTLGFVSFRRVPTSSSLDHERCREFNDWKSHALRQSNISAAATVEAAHSKADIMSIFEDLTQDDQDSVRLLAVKGCAALGKLSDLVPAYVRLLHDNEAEVRITAAGKVTKFCWILNPKLAIPPPPGNDIQAFIDLLKDELAAGSPTTDHVEGCDLCLDDFDAQLQLLSAGIN
ncbi:Serine/threonine-protein phosphatase 2A 65 kDa regulatory subunit A beta isoform [Vitis vinifera]|uniref:Serine/threonine-protein phosphatase 2A 65 kDa regulatory subunit A beta isoform n=1 Tax=Vitis vinifera TaxID=29760 RepID=A0A438IEZ7_VITVI|nr:Serine/threonine-protein phosphatase 2A 65 kDa regulatory subunit A beta isoform [Vitis vinifera]